MCFFWGVLLRLAALFFVCDKTVLCFVRMVMLSVVNLVCCLLFCWCVMMIYCEEGKRRCGCLNFVVHLSRLLVRALRWRRSSRGDFSRSMQRDGR